MSRSFKFNPDIGTKAVAALVNLWSKSGPEEQIQAHEVAVSLAMRYAKHGNTDQFVDFGNAIGAKFSVAARKAYFEWLAKYTSLTVTSEGEGKKEIFSVTHKKKGKMTFDETGADWDLEDKEGTNNSLWSFIPPSSAPIFDPVKKTEGFVKVVAKHNITRGQAIDLINTSYDKLEAEAAEKAKVAA